MTTRPVIRVIASVLIAAVFSGVALALGFTFLAGEAPALSADGIGWLLPILAVGMVGLLGWVMLTPRNRRDETVRPAMIRCTSCDATMMPDWRMCPYCGSMKLCEERLQE